MSPPCPERLPRPIFALGLLLSAVACGPAPPAESLHEKREVSFKELLAAEDPRFERAIGPRVFSFPEDHGPHPNFKTEWWYVTGNLDTRATGEGSNRRFGYQLTFFRSALTPRAAARSSAWATESLFMAHLALTDPATGRFRARERFSRDGLDLAGARSGPFAVWLEDWTLAETPDGSSDFVLRAHADTFDLELELSSEKRTVLHGDRGLSRKGDAPGNASYYYSMTRLTTRGTVTVDGTPLPVTGLSWLDREWSTSSLEPSLAGWDWVALQLNDGRDLMVYKLRLPDGSAHAASAGSLVGRDGAVRKLSASDFSLEPVAWWTSPVTGIAYPVRFELEVGEGDGDDGLALEVTSVLAEQEHTGAFLYWEGAVTASGRDASADLSGRGYVELTGYPDSASPRQ